MQRLGPNFASIVLQHLKSGSFSGKNRSLAPLCPIGVPNLPTHQPQGLAKTELRSFCHGRHNAKFFTLAIAKTKAQELSPPAN